MEDYSIEWSVVANQVDLQQHGKTPDIPVLIKLLNKTIGSNGQHIYNYQ